MISNSKFIQYFNIYTKECAKNKKKLYPELQHLRIEGNFANVYDILKYEMSLKSLPKLLW